MRESELELKRYQIIVRTLNVEGFYPARQSSFTISNINALLVTRRRKKMIGSRPQPPNGYLKSKGLAKEVGINPATLTGWRHRGWVQAKQAGRR